MCLSRNLPSSLPLSFHFIEPAVIPSGAFGGGKPPPAPRVVNTDFFKGKVKSIYEREPLFQVTIFVNIVKVIKFI